MNVYAWGLRGVGVAGGLAMACRPGDAAESYAERASENELVTRICRHRKRDMKTLIAAVLGDMRGIVSGCELFLAHATSEEYWNTHYVATGMENGWSTTVSAHSLAVAGGHDEERVHVAAPDDSN